MPLALAAGRGDGRKKPRPLGLEPLSDAESKKLIAIYHGNFTMIDPRKSAFMPVWDLIMLLALAFTAIVTPFEVTFIDEGACVTPLFVINRLVDVRASARHDSNSQATYVCMFPRSSLLSSPLFPALLSRLPQLLFICDIIIIFNLSYQEPKTEVSVRLVATICLPHAATLQLLTAS